MVDGATTWHRFRYVTLPGIRGTLIILLLFQLIVSMQTFDLLYSLTKGGPGDATTVIIDGHLQPRVRRAPASATRRRWRCCCSC